MREPGPHIQRRARRLTAGQPPIQCAHVFARQCIEQCIARLEHPPVRITVRDLFYNVPARRKFLRTDQTELAHIASLVTHYSLAHFDKTIRLSSGANELLAVTPVATLEERVYQVFGSQALDDLVEIGLREKELALPPPWAPPSQAISEYRKGDDEPTECRVANQHAGLQQASTQAVG